MGPGSHARGAPASSLALGLGSSSQTGRAPTQRSPPGRRPPPVVKGFGMRSPPLRPGRRCLPRFLTYRVKAWAHGLGVRGMSAGQGPGWFVRARGMKQMPRKEALGSERAEGSVSPTEGGVLGYWAAPDGRRILTEPTEQLC